MEKKKKRNHRYSLSEMGNTTRAKGLTEKYQLVLTTHLITFLFDTLIIDVVSVTGWIEHVVLAKMNICRIRNRKLLWIIFWYDSHLSLQGITNHPGHWHICFVPFYADSLPADIRCPYQVKIVLEGSFWIHLPPVFFSCSLLFIMN